VGYYIDKEALLEPTIRLMSSGLYGGRHSIAHHTLSAVAITDDGYSQRFPSKHDPARSILISFRSVETNHRVESSLTSSREKVYRDGKLLTILMP
jgi:hypothetical protein